MPDASPIVHMVACRYCHKNENDHKKLLKPCACAGSLAYTHVKCLETWQAHKPEETRESCEICLTTFVRPQTRSRASTMEVSRMDAKCNSRILRVAFYVHCVLGLGLISVISTHLYCSLRTGGTLESNANIVVIYVFTFLLWLGACFWLQRLSSKLLKESRKSSVTTTIMRLRRFASRDNLNYIDV